MDIGAAFFDGFLKKLVYEPNDGRLSRHVFQALNVLVIAGVAAPVRLRFSARFRARLVKAPQRVSISDWLATTKPTGILEASSIARRL